jgi:hypothetical protein
MRVTPIVLALLLSACSEHITAETQRPPSQASVSVAAPSQPSPKAPEKIIEELVPESLPIVVPAPLVFHKGISVGLYTESANRTYEQLLDEIAAHGADHVELIVHWWQSSLTANKIGPSSKFTIDDKRLLAVVGYAHKIGLKVFLYPYIDLYGHGGWRGSVAPTDWELWWRSYDSFILHYASLAHESSVELFAVGSEMTSAEGQHDHWLSLIREVKKKFSGKLVYAANWDRYQSISFADQIDYVGIDAYFKLTDKNDPTYEELVTAWQNLKKEILAWQSKSGQPFLFTELGYPSQDGANQRPWDYSSSAAVDLNEQLLCYQAFREVWENEPSLHGVFLWTWKKPGGEKDTSYSPRGKPAAKEIRNWFKGAEDN